VIHAFAMRLEDVFSKVLRVPAATLTDASSPQTVPGWDSMATMNLVAALEELHAIELSTAEIRNFTSLGAVRAVLRDHGVAT